MSVYQELITPDGRPLLHGVALETQSIFAPTKKTIPTFTALLDTGTYHTLVGQGIIDELGIKPSRTDDKFTTAGGNAEVDYYNDVTIIFPNGEKFTITVTCSRVYFSKLDQPPPFQIAIGMDILKHGILMLNGFTSRYILEFKDGK